MARCAATGCGHHPHPGRACTVTTVTGPPGGALVHKGTKPDEHAGRTIKTCECAEYVPAINGAEVPPHA